MKKSNLYAVQYQIQKCRCYRHLLHAIDCEKNLLAEDIVYSARMIVAKFLGMSPFKIIAIDKCV